MKPVRLVSLVVVNMAIFFGNTVFGDGPLKVYILAGQSNMQGHARLSTFEYIGKDPKTAPLLKEMLGPDGTPRVLKDVHITYLSENKSGPTEKNGALTLGFGADGDKIGPEYTFGIYMHKTLNEPILLIKTAWGGKSLHQDFRSSGSATDSQPTGEYYQKMIAHVKKVLDDPKPFHPAYNPRNGYEIAGFVWFQGWNDMVSGGVYPKRGQKGGYALYSELLAQFIRDVRKDLNAPKMRFVIGVLGVGGPTSMYESPRYVGIHQGFRDAMAAPAAMPEFKKDVVAVLTEEFWDHQLDKAKSKKEKTAEDMEIVKGSSNQGFHYLGAAKILGQIGKAFAEAMTE